MAGTLDNLKRSVTAVASGVLAFVESKNQGGLRGPAGEERPFQIVLEGTKIETTVKDPKVLIEPRVILIGAAAIALGVIVATRLARRR